MALQARDLFASPYRDGARNPSQALIDDLEIGAADVFGSGIVHSSTTQYSIADFLRTAGCSAHPNIRIRAQAEGLLPPLAVRC